MLELLRMDFVYFLVLVSLLIMLLGPAACVWVIWSIRRDIHRIADALALEAELAKKAESLQLYFERKPDSEGDRRVANSAFGR